MCLSRFSLLIARVCPSISSVMPSVFSVYAGWHIDHRVESRIQSFHATLQAEGESRVLEVAQTVKGLAKIDKSSLQDNTKYCVKLVAVYDDGVKAESAGKSFKNEGKYHSVHSAIMTTSIPFTHLFFSTSYSFIEQSWSVQPFRLYN